MCKHYCADCEYFEIKWQPIGYTFLALPNGYKKIRICHSLFNVFVNYADIQTNYKKSVDELNRDGECPFFAAGKAKLAPIPLSTKEQKPCP